MRRTALALVAACLLAACQKREGDAIVVAKEYIAAAASPAPSEAAPAAETAENDEAPREMRDDEVTADGYVMKRELRGTAHDPRALTDEQWRVTVRTVSDGRTFVVPAPQAQFEKVKEGDRVRVRYRTGKHTGTVWSAELVP